MTRYTIAVLPGDGIGPEVTAEALRVLQAAAELFGFGLDAAEYAVGAAGVAEADDALPPRTADAVVQADAVLLGAVGHPSLAAAEGRRRPEAGLLALRKLLGAYANLRPATVHPALRHASPLRPERLEGVDLLIVRELLGGLYYGQPRALERDTAVNTMRYSVAEIERVARVAFEAARGRRRLVTSVDKANVLEVSQLWRETVTRVALDYPDVQLEHLYVDYAAMRITLAGHLVASVPFIRVVGLGTAYAMRNTKRPIVVSCWKAFTWIAPAPSVMTALLDMSKVMSWNTNRRPYWTARSRTDTARGVIARPRAEHSPATPKDMPLPSRPQPG